ncbi:hypothetical protein PR048_008984 [Dryococelus australis]|uniref:DDE Tnp4 domain-containing protein n=1 Tax=Dryococelus australis TaxID=614101 RepID=A0ABQ9HYN0_9NEOP|nr:hypothetical protein PR048_008984 [Dryococelus australis]
MSDQSDFEDNLEVFEDFDDFRHAVPPARSPRNFFPRVDAFDKYNDNEFLKRFRVPKNIVLQVLTKIEDDTDPKTNRNMSVSALDQLLLKLRFYAAGEFLTIRGDFIGVHISTACQIVHRVTICLARMSREFVKMSTTQQEKEKVIRDFYQIAGYPKVLGALDCTHVPVKSPGGENAELYRNRKQFFSLNVQAVCDTNLIFMNLVARWPGFTHDSTIFNSSAVRAEFETGAYPEGFLLGDNIYPCRNYLHTPLLNPNTPAEQRYNSAHIKTRNTIVRPFGVIKIRFPCLTKYLQVNIDRVSSIMCATAALNNIACNTGIPDAPDDIEADVYDGVPIHVVDPVPAADVQDRQMGGMATRTALINTVFAR